MFLRSDRYRFFYKETPKCGSTTLIHRILRMHGIEPRMNPRRFLRKHSSSLASHGLKYGSLRGKSDSFFADLNRSYFTFSVVRNPYARTLSNYHNKLNRYAAKYAKRAYLAGKLKQLIAGPNAWSRANVASKHIAQHLSFADFVRGLSRHGLRFDSHYWTLCDLLQPHQINYDFILKLETIDHDLELLDQHLTGLGVNPVGNRASQQLNQSVALMAEPFSDRATQNLVHQLYQDDFARFNYAPHYSVGSLAAVA